MLQYHLWRAPLECWLQHFSTSYSCLTHGESSTLSHSSMSGCWHTSVTISMKNRRSLVSHRSSVWLRVGDQQKGIVIQLPWQGLWTKPKRLYDIDCSKIMDYSSYFAFDPWFAMILHMYLYVIFRTNWNTRFLSGPFYLGVTMLATDQWCPPADRAETDLENVAYTCELAVRRYKAVEYPRLGRV